MIKATVLKDSTDSGNVIYRGIVMEGHAGYAGEGQDIICAAVSALVINTVNSLEQLTGDSIKAKEKDGFVSFTFTAPISEGGTLLMDSLLLGLTEIEHSYSKRYLKVKVREV